MNARKFLKDEDGVVMVEFIIVFPFLAVLMTLIMYYIETTRFQMSALQLSAAHSWRLAAMEQTQGMARSDDFGFAGTSGMATIDTIHPRAPGIITEFKDAGHDYIALASGGAGMDIVRVMFLMPPGEAVWEYLSINPHTFNRNQHSFAPEGADYPARYRNQNFTRPVAAFTSTFIGKSDLQENEGLEMSDLEFAIAPAIPLMHDPFSIFWGKNEPHGGKIQRLRNVDRYTITSDPIYLAGLVLHGIMTANFRAPGHLTNELLLRDLHGPDSNVGGGQSLGGIMDLFSVVGSIFPSGGSKHAQPLWKVDKNADTTQHDQQGEVTYGGTDWGKEITEKHRLSEFQSTNDRWSMIQ
jgi:Flp pilus assembly pilin Flp